MRTLALIKPDLIKSDLALALFASAFVFAAALACGHPFIRTAANAATPLLAHQGGTQAVVLSGTILRSGEELFLREPAGRLYKLDDPQYVQGFEGKVVQIAGSLDAAAGMIHVETIAPAA